MQSKLVFANYAISSWSFFFYLIIDLYLVIRAIIVQIFNPIAEFIIPIELSIKEAKPEMEIHTVTANTKLRKCLI